MAQQAVGYLEVYGCVAALVAADAAAKAGNVTIDPLDRISRQKQMIFRFH